MKALLARDGFCRHRRWCCRRARKVPRARQGCRRSSHIGVRTRTLGTDMSRALIGVRTAVAAGEITTVNSTIGLQHLRALSAWKRHTLRCRLIQPRGWPCRGRSVALGSLLRHQGAEGPDKLVCILQSIAQRKYAPGHRVHVLGRSRPHARRMQQPFVLGPLVRGASAACRPDGPSREQGRKVRLYKCGLKAKQMVAPAADVPIPTAFISSPLAGLVTHNNAFGMRSPMAAHPRHRQHSTNILRAYPWH